jgi:thiamine-phosphate pyrophosphorylase
MGTAVDDLPRLFLVTDPRYSDTEIERVVADVGAAIPRGTFGVQLRDKERPPAAVRSLAIRLRVVTHACGALFVVNGDVSLAAAVEADGVHLGSDAPPFDEARAAFPEGWVSFAAHSEADVRRALAYAGDAALVSPIFETPGKGPPRGTAALARSVELARGRLAIYALGGIDVTRVRACGAAGADGIAVIRALLDAKEPGARARELLEELETRAPPPGLD